MLFLLAAFSSFLSLIFSASFSKLSSDVRDDPHFPLRVSSLLRKRRFLLFKILKFPSRLIHNLTIELTEKFIFIMGEKVPD